MKGYVAKKGSRWCAGHATPAFTISTYQHVPGMQADAARVFEQLIAPAASTDAARLKRRRKSA